jgi:predicted nucleic acid-binding protein
MPRALCPQRSSSAPSAMRPSKLVYWDSSVFIAWLKDEQRPAGEMDGVAESVEAVESGSVLLVTSVLTRTEVFEADLPAEVRDLYSALLKRRNVQLADVDLRITTLSRKLREFYRRQSAQDGKAGLTTPDAIHLATAIHLKVDEFYTFDDGKKGGRSLLSLDGNVAGHPLAIMKPPVTQYRLRWSANAA